MNPPDPRGYLRARAIQLEVFGRATLSKESLSTWCGPTTPGQAAGQRPGRSGHSRLQNCERDPEDIGVLVTRKWAIGAVAHALSEVGIPTPAHLLQASRRTFDLSDPCVKVITVHSGQGIEFDVVFLVGLEHLPIRWKRTLSTARGARVMSVRPVPRDQLVLTYTKDNAYLERIRALPETTASPLGHGPTTTRRPSSG